MGANESDFSKLSPELKQSGRFLVWKYGETKPNGKRPKLPCHPETALPHDKLDTAIWLAFEPAIKLAASANFQGIGLVIDTPFLGMDIDGVRNPENGEVEPWALELIAAADSYTEVSPSGTGFHVWLHGTAPPGANKRCGRVEVYAQWWFTVTGQHVPGTPSTIRRLNPTEVTTLYSLALRSDPKAKTDIPEPQATEHQLRERTKQLLALEPARADDQSSSVLSLLTHLAIDTRLDMPAAEALFKTSRLYTGEGTHWGPTSRENKWERLREEELRRAEVAARQTISKMLRGKPVPEPVDPDKWEMEFPALSKYDADDATSTEIIKDILVEGCVHLVSGYVANYKSFGVLEILSAVLDNRPAFDYFAVNESVDVIYVVPEMSHKLFLKYARYFGLNKHGEGFRHRTAKQGPLMPIDDERLRRAVAGKILVLDTLGYFTQSKDEKAAEQFLWFSEQCRYLIDVCGSKAIIVLHHPTKAGARATEIEITEFIRGSGAIAGLIDVAFAFRRIENTGKVFVKRLKGRPWEKQDLTFTLAANDEQGNSYLGQGRFPIYEKPGEAGELERHLPKTKAGRKPNPDKANWVPTAREAEKNGLSYQEIADYLKTKGFDVSKSTVRRTLQGDDVKGENHEIPF